MEKEGERITGSQKKENACRHTDNLIWTLKTTLPPLPDLNFSPFTPDCGFRKHVRVTAGDHQGRPLSRSLAIATYLPWARRDDCHTAIAIREARKKTKGEPGLDVVEGFVLVLRACSCRYIAFWHNIARNTVPVLSKCHTETKNPFCM